MGRTVFRGYSSLPGENVNPDLETLPGGFEYTDGEEEEDAGSGYLK